jgi:alpha-1,3-glucan synthase
MMMPRASVLLTLAISTLVRGLRYDPDFDKYNLNKAQDAVDPLKYWGDRGDFAYTKSPDNWRVPVYTLFLDRWVNGDPTNDNANGTVFEHDPNSNQMRHGGDLQGLIDSLDYIAGMGIKAIYIAGSIFINQPWGADSYSVSISCCTGSSFSVAAFNSLRGHPARDGHKQSHGSGPNNFGSLSTSHY